MITDHEQEKSLLVPGLKTRHLYSPLVLVAAFAVAACDGSNIGGISNGNTDSDGGPNVPVVPKLAADEADSLIRSSMIGYYTDTSMANGIGGAVLAAESVADTANSADGSGSGGARFSDTNVQEAGVDESDRVKTDGNIMFALERPSSQYYGVFPVDAIAFPEVSSDQALPPYTPPVDTLSAYRLDQENSQTLSRFKLDLGSQTPDGMYLHKNGADRSLVMLSKNSFNSWGNWTSASAFTGLQTRVTWIDANDATNMSLGRTLDIDGQLISSRKIENRLILVTRFHPQIDGIVVPYNEEAAASNRTQIESAEIASLLPGYRLESDGNVTTGQIVSNNLCYRSDANVTNTDGDSTSDNSDDALPPYHSPSVVSIISIDLNDQSTSIKNTCFIGDTETMYVSPSALYLATTQYQYNLGVDTANRPLVSYYPPEITTEIHKFKFNGAGAPEFRGSGSVSGHLGWYPDRKPFRMSEKDNNLRVVTFDGDQGGSPVRLNILTEGDGARMNTLSTLPNENRPAHIGKEGENLYASRFIGDRAYLVTFRVTDPLYVLDLTNPNDPSIAGELELPGYSDYLHPVSDTLMLGVGKDAIPAEGLGWGDGRGAFYQGVKLALFDVSDSSNPFVADSRVIGKRGTETPALYQHHSFAWLPGSGNRNARMAIPVSLHDESVNGNSANLWSDWTANKMLTMEVDEGATAFVDVPDWTFESRTARHTYSPVSLEHDRAVIGSNGGLYVIHNGSLQYGLWGNEAPTSATE